MSVVGFDFGNLQSVIAVARNRGIDVVCNEVTNRATPSLVSFGPKQRYIGEAAKTQEISNFKNTVGSLKRLVGRAFQDREIQEIEKQYINAELVDANGQVGVKVKYLGEDHVFSATQLVAMYINKLKETASRELRIPVSDVVISVPDYFTDIQRRAILEAAEICGLNCLRLLNDTTASALGYGITRDLPESKPRHVVFVDIGHSDYSVAVVSFIKGQLTVKATAYDRHFGGRNFDNILVDHFAEQFKEKYKIDVKSNPKALFRLRTACEKLKKVLSANPQAPLNVESIMNDVDVSSFITRQEFEDMIGSFLDRVETPLAQALKDSGLTKADIHSIELVGGSTRIPAVKERISNFFGKDLNFTLNQDEAIARGCALQCAILSPVFKVREFTVQDITAYPIKVRWEKIPEIPEEESELLVFPKSNAIPSTKVLTFHRKQPFDIEAIYAEPESLPGDIKPWIGRFSIKKVESTANKLLTMVKVKVKLNLHGILSVDGAYVVEEVIKDEKEEAKPEQKTEKKSETKPETKSENNSEAKPETPSDTTNSQQPEQKTEPQAGETPGGSTTEPKQDEPQPMDTDKPEEPVKPKKKKLVKKNDLPVVSCTAGLDKKAISQYRELEGQMLASDKLVIDTETQKNALEEYVYDIRGKVESSYSSFVDPADKEKFINLLNETEDWLYDEGEDSTKSVYVQKLEDLKKYGSPIVERYRESEERPKAEKQLRDTIETYLVSATNTDDKLAHIPEDEKKKVVDKATQALQWLDEKIALQNNTPAYKTPVVYARDIYKERDSLSQFANPILNKPKPAPPKTETATPPETPAENGNKESTEKTDKPDNNDQKEKTTETNQQENEPAQMEVD
ncbi:5513_t:CDS:2 [Paraglomus occultum]|uniref:5513_t:CDS:1 n=1 Tax=Paraglomus occultum TaxID=144539 RepID=A0A9N9FC51_9GLOM|nr:5513_t:CDS:2 [Paraglomus occultum]